MCRLRTERAARVLVAVTALGALLGGCSDFYYDHRESIALGAGDAVAANAITQMVDPWPASSGNVHIAANGQKMQAAIERYRTNKVTPPADPMGLEVSNQQPLSTTVINGGGPASSGSSAAPSSQ